MDADEYFSMILKLNEKFKGIKEDYEKDDDMIIAHVLTSLPDEYKEFCPDAASARAAAKAVCAKEEQELAVRHACPQTASAHCRHLRDPWMSLP